MAELMEDVQDHFCERCGVRIDEPIPDEDLGSDVWVCQDCYWEDYGDVEEED